MRYPIMNGCAAFLAVLIFSACSIFDKDDTIYLVPRPTGGCPDVTYPDWKTSPYILPYPVGKSYQIDLSNCDGSYHSEGLPDAFAIDFRMDIGTLITASRAGEVIYVEESGFDGGHPNNLVVVDHGDSTFAEYMHLTHNGAIAEVGDVVKPGDKIGYSGSTGLAGYPHLHFVVARGTWQWPYQSTPVTFRNTQPNVGSLVSGFTYKALSY
ncbi:MAG: M23 family peptidase [Calditrichaeota bacterium]|nr:MAG: M23 family peptidase [Calditrichota bacterium]